ncbi:HAD-IB family hydrolase [Psychromonas sp. psych-6C06]|uniref:HAD family hydrolase n=1 Tax=Psychromonas sp. psych-6C06 TaxID=2058089 RepID=UPI000C34D1CC|nr:HAD family hydrolase [Psychromonas sp. psych-6C06]PKF61630.1 HAD-IB family hydrolase [Psychromonas sp. psych-6C06]
MPRALHVFDMDDTLVNGDCSMLWNEFLVKRGIITEPNFLETDRKMMALYAKGEMDMASYLQFSLAPIATIRADKIDKLVDQFVENVVLPRVFPEALALIQQLKEGKVPLLIISATVTFIVQKVATCLGIEHAIGIDLHLEDRCYSHRVSGIASYREGKIERLNHWLEAEQFDFEEIHFYTDSINDLPLCLYADHAYLINPCTQLSAQQKINKQWLVYEWGK